MKLKVTVLVFLTVSAFLAVIPSPASAQIYHPLSIGSQWQYENVVDGPQIMTITGERTVLGAVTRIRHQEELTQTYENYWTQDEAGNLYLHGAFNYDGFEIAFLPAIQMVSSPLYEGKYWVTEDIYDYDLDGNPLGGGPFDYPVRVYSEGTIEVPAGEFYAYGVGYDIYLIPLFSYAGEVYDILGRRVSESDLQAEDNSTHWYTVDVGEVQMGYGDFFQLASYDFPVPVHETSWGRVRLLFH